ncbi:MAG: DUF4338 domain-containing protein [Rhodocyclaceae bacterium]|nr:DUF4338 domain-containing protein [Rhodocyclaceae bacterium]
MLAHLANGRELDPARIAPRLVEVERETTGELLFRYARLHWSIPVSAGYGRRLRFLVWDDGHDRLMGILNSRGDPAKRKRVGHPADGAKQS